MLIEFAGIPGSGKSHLCNALRKRLELEKISFVDIDDFIRKSARRRLRHALKRQEGRLAILDLGNKRNDVFLRAFASFYRKHHAYVYRYSTCLFEREQDPTAVKSVLSTFMYCCARYAYFMDRKETSVNVVVHEEGFSQRIFTLFGYDIGNQDSKSDICAIAEEMPVPQVLVWTRCPPEIAFSRMLRRSGKKLTARLQNIKQETAEHMLARADANFSIAAEVLRRRGVKVEEIWTDQDTGRDRILEDVITAVNRTVQSR